MWHWNILVINLIKDGIYNSSYSILAAGMWEGEGSIWPGLQGLLLAGLPICGQYFQGLLGRQWSGELVKCPLIRKNRLVVWRIMSARLSITGVFISAKILNMLSFSNLGLHLHRVSCVRNLLYLMKVHGSRSATRRRYIIHQFYCFQIIIYSDELQINPRQVHPF